ncbi:glycosyltransferase family 4 protein [Adhaeribacter aquaticus]|uniref:glycosyltransferase family 4 protein n=1 Tax=Adhaeribacter aquaticus TaxID=299567 RepID=UPI000400F080|nr:glycosyltransferase family 1 protein [Adhaeribacter aquaticus]
MGNTESLLIVNARFLTQPLTGVQRFAVEISLQLKRLLPNIIFVSPKNILQKDIALELNVQTFGRFTSHLWEQLELPFFLKKEKNAVLLNLCNTAPLFYNRNIVTIHDIAFQINPQWFSPAFVKLYNFLIPRIAKKSLEVITVSNCSKQALVEYTQIPEEKVNVIYNGISKVFTTLNGEGNKAVPEDFILAVSSIDPRKNFISLVKAFKGLNIKGLNLVVVGSESKVFSDTNLKEEIQNCPSIIFTGYLPDTELATLYRKAKIFVYPSIYEGFGIPPLEAMASGSPTIVSNTASLPEICGEASLYVNPLDVKEIMMRISQLYFDVALQKTLTEKGLKQIQKYSWEKSAKQVEAVITKYL